MATEVTYGFIPNELWDKMNEREETSIRVKSIMKLITIVRGLTDVSPILPHKVAVLQETFKLIDDLHGNVSLQGFILLGKLIEKVGKGFSAETLEYIIPKMIEKWGEPKQVVRHSTSAVMTKVVTRILPPHQLSSCLIAQLNSQNSHVKEEMINFVCYCLLKHPSCPYEYPEIVHGLCSSLKDSSLRVKIVSAEALAVVYRNIGDELTPLLEPVRESDKKTYNILQKRFKQPILPMLCKTKGVIQHKLLIKLNAQQYKRKRVQSAFRNHIPTSGLDGTSNLSEKRRHYRRRHMRAHSAPRRMQAEDELASYATHHHHQNSSIDHSMHESTQSKRSVASTRSLNNRYSHIDPGDNEPEEDFHTSSETSSINSHRLPNIKNSTPSSRSSTRSSKVSIWLRDNHSEQSEDPSYNMTRQAVQRRGTSKRTFYPSGAGPEIMESPVRAKYSRESLRSTDSSPSNNRYKNTIDPYDSSFSSSHSKSNDSATSLSSRDSTNGNLPHVTHSSSSQASRTLLKEEYSINVSGGSPLKIDPSNIKKGPKISIPTSPAAHSPYDPSPVGSVVSAPGGYSKRPKRLRLKKRVNEPRTPSNLESGQSPLGSRGQLTHIATTDLEPSDSPQIELREALKGLSSANWDEQHRGVTSIRRMCAHHPQLLRAHVSTITGFILKHIDGLRSLLCKNAIVCIEDMFTALAHQMDTSLPKSIPLLLKKTSDTNRFISSQAERSLIAAVRSCSKDKIISAMIVHTTNKNSTIRGSTALVLHNVILESGKKLLKLREFERMITVIIKFLSDSSVVCRSRAKQMAAALFTNIETHHVKSPETVLMKHLRSQSDVRTLMEAAAASAITPATPTRKFKSPRHKAVRGRSRESPSNRRKFGADLNTPASPAAQPEEEPVTPTKPAKPVGVRRRAVKKPRASKLDSVTVEELQAQYAAITVNDWQKRLLALECIENLFLENSDNFSEHDIVLLYDSIIPRLVDPHVKVNAAAYAVLNNIFPATSSKMGNLRLRIFQSILQGMNSSSSRIKKNALESFDVCIEYSSRDSALSVFPHLVNSTQSAKNQIQLLNKFSVWVKRWADENVGKSKPSLKKRSVLRYLVPTINRLYKSASSHAQLRSVCVSFLKVLYKEMGENLFGHGETPLSRSDMSTVRAGAA